MVWFDVYNNITLTPDRLRSWVSVMSYKSDYLGLEHSRPGLPPPRGGEEGEEGEEEGRVEREQEDGVEGVEGKDW